ncbi:MAG: hypothetical protein JNK63_09485 [Chthonomonas sp.]|nr:hypothetical protein [Chthonomonas sp.]
MKPIIAIVGAVILAGGFVGAAKTGVIKVPGLTPAPKAVAKKPAETKPVAKKTRKSVSEPVETPEPKPEFTVDADKGAAAVAEVWNGVDTGRLALIVSDWNDTELARVMFNMDSGKASQLLAALPSDRASRVSLQLQDMASQVPVEN